MLPVEALPPAERARLARQIGVTLPDGRVWRNGVIVSAQDAANTAATRARDAAFAAQTGEYRSRSVVDPNQAGRTAFANYMGAVQPEMIQAAPVQPSFQPVPSTPVATPESAAEYTRAEQERAQGFNWMPEITQSPSLAPVATAFMQGGYTGPGPKTKPAGVVHAGEFVIPADKVKEIGVEKLDAYFGTDSSKPKSEFQVGGLAGVDPVTAELLSYQGLIPGRNITPESVARATPQQRLNELAAAKRAFAEINGERALARQEAAWQRNEQARIAREERAQAERRARDARQAEFLRSRQPEIADEVQKFQDEFVAKQQQANQTLAGIAASVYEAGVAANAPWLTTIGEDGITPRPLTFEEFAGEAQRRGTPAAAAVADALQRNPVAVRQQTEVATAKRNFNAAALRLNANLREYEAVRSADPILQAPEAEAPVAEQTPVPAAEQYLVQGQPVSRDVAQRAADVESRKAAGDFAMAEGRTPQVSSPAAGLPQGSIGYARPDGQYAVILPGQKIADAQVFPNEAAAVTFFGAERQQLETQRATEFGLSPAAQTAYLTGGDFVDAPVVGQNMVAPAVGAVQNFLSPAPQVQPPAPVPSDPVFPQSRGALLAQGVGQNIYQTAAPPLAAIRDVGLGLLAAGTWIPRQAWTGAEAGVRDVANFLGSAPGTPLRPEGEQFRDPYTAPVFRFSDQ